MSLIVYTKRGCPWCEDVLALLREHAISFEERECHGNKAFFEELQKKSGQTKTPTLDFDGEILTDTDVEEVKIFLRKKGILS